MIECEHCEGCGADSVKITAQTKVSDYDCICEDCLDAIKDHHANIDALAEDRAKGEREIAFGMRKYNAKKLRPSPYCR